MHADDRVQVQTTSQPSRGDSDFFLGPLDLDVDQLLIRQRPVGVGLSTLSDIRIGPRESDDLGGLGLRLLIQGQAGLGLNQVEEERGDFEQGCVDRRLGVEPGPGDVLPRGQRLEDHVGQRADDVHGRDGNALRGDRPHPAAEVECLLR